jgi:DNA helicase-2/ATP-dependent DNA helicase PcrA
MIALLDSLNPVQRQAVELVDGPVLILAGAGSGKTRVLTHKVAHLVVDRGVPRHRILAFTFTNKAALEMRERIGQLLEGETRGLWIGTFHATCLRILRQYAQEAGLDRGFTIYDRDDSLSVVKRSIKALNLSDTEYRPRTILERISAAKSSLLTPADLRAEAFSRIEELVGDLYGRYETELREKNALDFDDLLVRALALLRDDERTRTDLAGRFRYVLVDEYQDTNKVQFELTRLLAATHRNLTVVGDDDQSIYAWRGADITNILDFEKSYPDATTLRLEQNYRSTKRILAAANAVVRHNSGRKEKTLWTENPDGERLVLTVAPDEEREAEDIVRRALEHKNHEGRRLWEMAVLYRTNAQSRPLEDACLRARVPYRIVGGVHFFARREVKDVLAYLKLAANPLDQVAFERAVAVPKRGVGKVSIDKVVALATAKGGDLVQACMDAAVEAGISGKAAHELLRFGNLIRRVQEEPEDAPADQTLEMVIRESGMVDELLRGGPDATTRRENLDELVSGARHHALREETPGYRAYLEEVSLRTDLDGWDPGEEYLTLMTVHNAKGLEFEVVFVAGLEEGLFPHQSSMDDPAQLEEERRLFYVALTRAKERGHLSASLDRRRMNRFEPSVPSRFLDEVPDEHLERRDPWGLGLSSGRLSRKAKRVTRQRSDGPYYERGGGGGGSGAPDPTHGRPRRLPPSRVTEGGWEEPTLDLDGDRETPELLGKVVFHARYGRGVVLAQEGRGEAAKCHVRFMGQLTKKIVARFLDVEDDPGGA